MLKKFLRNLKRKHLYRSFRTISGGNSTEVQYNGKKLLMLASNNYFGLTSHPKVKQGAIEAVKTYGSGNGASRLVVNLPIQERLEKTIASYKKEEAALLYTSGYAANIGIISSLVGRDAVILSDALNHASIIDGCRLSKAEVLIYEHCNMTDLEHKLQESKGKTRLVVTDSVFSMTGDLAPLKEILSLKKKCKFTLMIDDAHATGIVDTNFSGVDVHMGTLSKSLASQGGYVAGSQALIDFLRNTSRSFFFSTGLSPANCGAALEALHIIQNDGSLKEKLLENAEFLREGLRTLGFVVKGEHQILSLELPDFEITMAFQEKLEARGIFVTGIRPPTVIRPMLRITVMSTHTKQQLEKALFIIGEVGRDLQIR